MKITAVDREELPSVAVAQPQGAPVPNEFVVHSLKLRRRIRPLCTALAVIGVHISMGWLLWRTTWVLARPTVAREIEIVFIAPVARFPGARSRSPADSGSRPLQRTQVAAPATPLTSMTLPPDDAIHPQIDWDGELERAARDSVASESPSKRYPAAGLSCPWARDACWCCSRCRSWAADSAIGRPMAIC
jgi:hypothetical protein